MPLQNVYAPTSPNQAIGLSKKLIFSLSAGAGLSVAAIYYNQPMIENIGQDFQSDISATGFVPTLTQIGYALGILLLIPLGDRFNRRHVILTKGLLLAIALLLCSFMPTLNGMLVLSLAIGMFATMAQDIVPTAAILSSNSQKGKAVGTVMAGLLLGILLSRVISGVVTQYIGWRVMYQAAAASILIVCLVLWRTLPNIEPHTKMRYPALMRSMFSLWTQHPILRRAAVSQGFLSLSFSAFWSTLAVMLHQEYGFGSATAGFFGLAGAAGALAAPLSGKLTDKQGPTRVTQLGAALVVVSFASMLLLPYFSISTQVVMIIVATIVFDFGVQAALIAHQTLVYNIDSTARGRLNALLFTCVFIGMAIGSALASQALMYLGWSGVIALATVSAIVSLNMRITARSA